MRPKQQARRQRIVPVGESVCLHIDDIADDTLDRKAAAFDLRPLPPGDEDVVDVRQILPSGEGLAEGGEAERHRLVVEVPAEELRPACDRIVPPSTTRNDGGDSLRRRGGHQLPLIASGGLSTLAGLRGWPDDPRVWAVFDEPAERDLALSLVSVDPRSMPATP